jgi:hypothetical protein
MVKCYEVTPGGWFDTLIIKADSNTWEEALRAVETALDGQYLDDKKWDEIQVSVRCVTLTEEEFAKLESE